MCEYIPKIHKLYSEKQGIIENPDRNGWCNARSPESSIQFDNSLLIDET